MKRFILLASMVASLGLISNVHAKKSQVVDLGPPQAGVKTEIVEIKAKVADIDYATRHITLQDDKGGTLTFQVDEKVANLNKVKKGNLVSIKYQESLSWRLLPQKEKTSKTVTDTTTTTMVNKKPDVTKSSQTDIIATIKAIDKATPSVTLAGPEGNQFTVLIKNPAVLDVAKVGQQVSISYTESLAVGVEKAKK